MYSSVYSLGLLNILVVPNDLYFYINHLNKFLHLLLVYWSIVSVMTLPNIGQLFVDQIVNSLRCMSNHSTTTSDSIIRILTMALFEYVWNNMFSQNELYLYFVSTFN